MTLTPDQMEAARVAILSRVVNRMTLTRAMSRPQTSAHDRYRMADFETRNLVAETLDINPTALGLALDDLDHTPAREGMTDRARAEYVLRRARHWLSDPRLDLQPVPCAA